MTDLYKSLHPAKYYRDYLNEGTRPDGRGLESFRPVLVNVNSITTADGSAIVKIGKTTVVCGIKAELCKPKAEQPDSGFLIINVELPPLCSPKFRPGPPSNQAQVSTQFLADIVENSKCVDLKDLCLFPDKLAWCLYADLICLDFDGAVIDTCLVALLAALKSVKLPGVEYDPALDNKQINLDDRKLLNLYSMPISTTFAILDEQIIVTDPTIEEENLCTGLLTIVINGSEVCTVHKPGGSALEDVQLLNCIEICKQRTPLVCEIINTSLK